MKKTYIEEYNDFWKEIVENENGSLNKDQVMRELSDYSMVMDNCTQAYLLMSRSNISKPNTNFDVVEGYFKDNFLYKDCTQDDIEEAITNINDIEELKDFLRVYFEL